MKKMLLVALAGLLILTGCGGDTKDERAKSVSCEPDESPLTVKARNTDFDTDCLAAKADSPLQIKFVNEEVDDHNIAIYESKGGEALFQGTIIKKGDINYEVPAISAGRHYFQCDTHPEEMNGAFVVLG